MEAAIGPRPMADARVGQKTGITRRWDCSLSRNLLRKPVPTFRIALERGTRPSAPKDLRTTSAYIFGAICPAQGKVAGQSRGPRHAAGQHRSDGGASGRNIAPCRLRRTGRADPRSGGLARLSGADRAGEYHAPAAAAQMPRTEPG